MFNLFESKLLPSDYEPLFQNVKLKHMVGEMSGRGNVVARKYLVREVSFLVSGWVIVRLGKYPSGSGCGDLGCGQVSVRDLSSRICQSGNSPVRELFAYLNIAVSIVLLLLQPEYGRLEGSVIAK